MKEIRIVKGRKVRIVYAPNNDERETLAGHMKTLRGMQKILRTCVHGFVPGRSAVTNAAAHRGYEHTLTMDIRDFFDSVTMDHVRDYLLDEMLREVSEGGVFYKGRARQGLPTSPFVANLAAHKMDGEIVLWLQRNMSGNANYTRYADDLAVSWNGDRALHKELREVLTAIARKHGFEIASHKTRLQSRAGGRRVICGVSVDYDLRPTREFRRRMRAVEHKLRLRQPSVELEKALNDGKARVTKIDRVHRGMEAWKWAINKENR